ncbi:hypothetical protein WJX79_007364 [Trebouxia sp. C0005]
MPLGHEVIDDMAGSDKGGSCQGGPSEGCPSEDGLSDGGPLRVGPGGVASVTVAPLRVGPAGQSSPREVLRLKVSEAQVLPQDTRVWVPRKSTSQREYGKTGIGTDACRRPTKTLCSRQKRHRS